MITELTKEQQDQIPLYRDRWIDIGLSTNTDRARADELIPEVYKAGGIEPPKKVLWFESPMGLLKWYAENENVSLRNAWSQINFCYGTHDASWLAFYEYFKNECGIKECEKLTPLTELSKVCGWFAPYRNVCLMSDKPTICKTEINHRGNHQLHSEDGPAIQYGDGYSVYALHGTRVPAHLVETPAEELNVDFLDSERNADIRRVFIQKVGIKRVIQKLNPVTLHEADGYTLLKVGVASDSTRVYLQMKDATTSEWYIEPVPRHIKTVEEALAWRDDEEVFVKPLIRT